MQTYEELPPAASTRHTRGLRSPSGELWRLDRDTVREAMREAVRRGIFSYGGCQMIVEIRLSEA
jgi:hypothetical protein